MTRMPWRKTLLVLLAVVPLVATAVVVFRPSPPPPVALVPPPSPAPEPPAAEPPAPEVRTESITLRRGDTLVSALGRLGVDRRASADIAAALRDNGADLRRMRPNDELAITWTLDGDPVSVRWEPSPWLGFAVVATDSGWEVRREETRPDVRVEAVGGEVRRSLFEAVEALGESPQLVLELVEIFSSDFDFTADSRGATASACWSRSATPVSSSWTTARSWSRSTSVTAASSPVWASSRPAAAWRTTISKAAR